VRAVALFSSIIRNWQISYSNRWQGFLIHLIAGYSAVTLATTGNIPRKDTTSITSENIFKKEKVTKTRGSLQDNCHKAQIDTMQILLLLYRIIFSR